MREASELLCWGKKKKDLAQISPPWSNFKVCFYLVHAGFNVGARALPRRATVQDFLQSYSFQQQSNRKSRMFFIAIMKEKHY